ncbi:hypothetical protein J437_LFUL011154 [Ladona fulva]|uniref:Methionine adenosyltransferase 2 subunit beta n=1 Tax=Ladona fulva TaxID=123851 RepID=A0A8K0P0G4_LADFU|nr:hypothetical protein J437_LFUL011154 [Ladona fulva]
MDSTNKRLFLTGASGLLGRAILKKFSEYGWEVLGTGFSRVSPPLIKVDLHDVSSVQKILAEFKPSFIIHSAAVRFPDQVESNPEEAVNMNVKVSQHLASISDKIGVPLLYISTDYVFDGKKPPYKVEDQPCPVNLYGNLILRIPVLYGTVEKLSESAVTTLLEPLLNTSKPCSMSNYERRYPAHVNDIAEICHQLGQKKLEDPSICGIFQWSGQEMLTKYQMICKMAKVFSLPCNHVTPVDGPGAGAVTRPYDSQMDVSSLVLLFKKIPHHTPFEEGIKECLQPWTTKKAQ